MEPKLTIEEAKAAWHATFRLHAKSFEEYCADLLKCGLIAPEPVPDDPLLEEAEALHGEWNDGLVGEPGDTIDLAFAALRRGMELQREAWTPERVREAVKGAIAQCTTMLALYDFDEDAPADDVENLEGFLGRLHAALTQPPHADKGVG